MGLQYYLHSTYYSDNVNTEHCFVTLAVHSSASICQLAALHEGVQGENDTIQVLHLIYRSQHAMAAADEGSV